MATKAPTVPPATPPVAPTVTQPPAAPTSAAPEPTVPLDLTSELKSMEQGYTKQPDKFILTVKVKKFFFPVKEATISIQKDGKEVDSVQTDRKGVALFDLLPGDYTVQYGEKKVPINIKEHSTLKL